MRVKNLADGPRGFNIKSANGPVSIVLAPGQVSDEIELVNPECPVFLGMVQARQLEVEAAQTSTPAPVAEATPAPSADDAKKKG